MVLLFYLIFFNEEQNKEDKRGIFNQVCITYPASDWKKMEIIPVLMKNKKLTQHFRLSLKYRLLQALKKQTFSVLSYQQTGFRRLSTPQRKLCTLRNS